jgi:hypothetical protein
MKFSNILILFLFFLININANGCYILTKNNFMKFYLKLENYYFKKILNNVGCRIDNLHSFTCNKINSLSIRYNTLSYEEKEMLEAINFFL